MKQWLAMAGCLFVTAAPVMGAAEPVQVAAGKFILPVLLEGDQRSVSIDAFWLDATPVTNAQFMQFVQSAPAWRRDQIAGLFHDGGYLSHWPSADVINVSQRDTPVTYVSWYAARAYCEAQGGRLPTLHEWEYAATVYRQQQGLSDSDYANQQFAWYSNPAGSQLQPLNVNATSLQHMHGRINEWVEDYQLLIQSGDSVDVLSGSCGDSARFLASFNNANYATFFRYQSRSDYSASNTTSTLGFRCAYDAKE